MASAPVLQLAFNFDEPNAVQLPASTPDGPLLVWIDEADAQRLKGRKLHIGSHGYAQIWDGERTVLLHRWLMGCKVRDGRYVDHLNGDVLDCRRSNLRVCTAAENAANRKTIAASGFKGVYRHRSKWQARAKRAGRITNLGLFDSPEEAAWVAHMWRVQNLPGYLGRDRTTKPAGRLALAA